MEPAAQTAVAPGALAPDAKRPRVRDSVAARESDERRRKALERPGNEQKKELRREQRRKSARKRRLAIKAAALAAQGDASEAQAEAEARAEAAELCADLTGP